MCLVYLEEQADELEDIGRLNEAYAQELEHSGRMRPPRARRTSRSVSAAWSHA
jgi:hypothetical protein